MARKSVPQEPALESRQLSAPEIELAIKKLRRRIDDVRALDPSTVRFDDARVRNVEHAIRDSIREIFGDHSSQFRAHSSHTIWHGGYNYLDSEYERQSKFAAGIPQTVTILEGLVSRLEEKREDLGSTGASSAKLFQPSGNRRVFVVHGRDEAAKEATARFLAKLRLEPVILHEQANQGRTIIEKFEGHADVDFAVVLLTPDDFGGPEGQGAKPRARQNVVFELGYFVGRLGRERVCALHKGDVELPSDIDGVLYVPIDVGGAWHLILAREIKAAGIDIDLNDAL